MARNRYTLNVTLDDEYAAILARLAERAQVTQESLARSLLTNALDEVDADPRYAVQRLNGISGAHERARLGLEQARDRRTLTLDEF